MKTFIALFFLLKAINANAFFYCETTAKTEEGNPEFSISVYEKTSQRPYVFTSLARGDKRNVPEGFGCEDHSINEDKSIVTEYDCESFSDKLVVYVSKDKKTFTANLYSKDLNIEVDNLNCTKE